MEDLIKPHFPTMTEARATLLSKALGSQFEHFSLYVIFQYIYSKWIICQAMDDWITKETNGLNTKDQRVFWKKYKVKCSVEKVE